MSPSRTSGLSLSSARNVSMEKSLNLWNILRLLQGRLDCGLASQVSRWMWVVISLGIGASNGCTMYNTYNCTERIIHHFALILIATRLVLKYVDLHGHGMIFYYNNFCHDLNIIHYPMLQTRDAWTYLKSTAIACRSVLRFKRFDLVVILSAQWTGIFYWMILPEIARTE